MDQEKKKKGLGSQWNNPFPVERKSQNQSPSGRGAVKQNRSIESHCLQPSHVNLLTSFGLSFEDLEELSQYPDNQLTPENIPVLLQKIQKSKLASKKPILPSKSTEKESVSSGDGRGPTVKKKVIDYGHKSKYGYNEDPMEANASSIATGDGMKGFQPQQSASVPAVASRLISKPKNPTMELLREVRSRARRPNLQVVPCVNPAKKVPLAELGVPPKVPPVMPPVEPSAPPITPPALSPAVNQSSFVSELLELLRRHGKSEHTPRADPPNRPCRTVAGQKSFWKEAEEPFKSPFGVVKASWLPDFSQTDKQKEKKLPTSPQMCDYYAVTPRIFPHTCSLCNEACIDKKDWIQHQNTLLHNENCRRLLQQYPDWAPENPSSPKRHEGDRQERHESRQPSASPSPKRSRRSSSGHARHRTRSRSRSSGRHRTSRSRNRNPRHSSSGHARHQTRSRSRSSERYWRGRPRSRSPRRFPSPRRRSRSPWQSLPSRRRSRSSSIKERGRHESRLCSGSPSPEHPRHSASGYARHRTRSRSRSSGRHRASRPRSRSPRRRPSPRHRSRSPRRSLQSSRLSRSSSSKEKKPGSSTRSTEGRCAKTPYSKKALASLTEKSVLQAMAQLQDKGAADGTLTQGMNSAQEDKSAASSNLISMIQQVTTQIVTAVLDSRGESTTRGSTSTRDPNLHRVNSKTKKAKIQSVVGPTPQQGSTEGTKGLSPHQNSAKGSKGPGPKQGSAKGTKGPSTHQNSAKGSKGPSTNQKSAKGSKGSSTKQGSAKGTKGPSTQQGTAKGIKDPSSRQGTVKGSKGPSSQQGTVKVTKGPSPQQGSADSIKGPSPQQGSVECTKGPSPQQGSAEGTKVPSPQQGSVEGTKGPSPQQGSAESIKDPSPLQGSAKGTKGPSPQQGTAEGSKCPSPQQGSAEGTKVPSPQQGSAEGTKVPSPQQGNVEGTKDPSPQKATMTVTKGLNPQQGSVKGTKGPSPQQGSAKGIKGLSPQQGSEGSKGSSPQKATVKDTKGSSPQQVSAEGTKCPSPQQGIAKDSKGPSPQQGSAESTKGLRSQQGSAESIKDLSPQQGSAESTKGSVPQKATVLVTKGLSPQQGSAEGTKVPSPQQNSAKGSEGLSPQQGNVESSKGLSLQQESMDSTKGPSPQQGSADGAKGPGPQHGNAKSTKAKVESPESPCPKQGTFLCRKAENKPVVSPGVQQGTAATGMEETVHIGEQWPEPVVASSVKATNDSVPAPSPHQGIAVSGKAESQGEAAVSSQPVSIKAEPSDVASPGPQPGTAGPCEAENKEVEQKLIVSIPLSLDKPLEAEVECLGPQVVEQFNKQKSQREAGRGTSGPSRTPPEPGKTLGNVKKNTSSPAVPQKTSKRDSVSHYDPSDVKAKPPEGGGTPDGGGVAAEGKERKLPRGTPVQDTIVAHPLPYHRVEVPRKEVKKQEPSKASPVLKKDPEGSGLVPAASVPSAKPTEAKEEPSSKSKAAAAEVKKEPSEKVECEAPSEPPESATSEGEGAALTTKAGDLSLPEVKPEKASASSSSLGEEEKVPDKADAELLGNASTSTARNEDQALAGPAGELSEELKGGAQTEGMGADPAKTEQGAETAPAICETVLLGSTEAPVEELSGEDLQSDTQLEPPGTDHTDASRSLPERSPSEVGVMAEGEPENPSSTVDGGMEAEPETPVPETTGPAEGKPELQTGEAEAASEKQPEVLISTDKSTQEEKLGKEAGDRSPEQRLPKTQLSKEMGPDQPEESAKAEVLATELAPRAEATSVSKTISKALMSVPNISKKRTVTRRKEKEQKPSIRSGTRSSTAAEKKPVPKEASHQRRTNSRSNLPDSKSKRKPSSSLVKVGRGKSSSQQDKDSQVETKGSSKQTQEQEARPSSTKRDSSKEKVSAGRNTSTKSSNSSTNLKEEEELFPFNLDEFVTVDEVTDEADSPTQPRRNPLRAKRKDAAHEPSSKRKMGKTSVVRETAEQELSFITLDEIGEVEGGMAQALEHLEALPDPQVLVTVDEMNDEEEPISQVAQDPQALVTLDEISEQEDPAAQEATKEADREPDLKEEPLGTVDEIGGVEELPLNEPSHFKTETLNDGREEKQVLEDPGLSLSSQVPEYPRTLGTVDEIHKDNDAQPLEEVTEEDDDFLEGEFNFVTVDEVGSEEEEEVTVTSTDMEEAVCTTVPEKEIAVAEPTEGLLLAAKREETVTLEPASSEEKVCPGEDLPEEKKTSEAQMESAAAETDAQETTFVDAEKESVAAETDAQETTFVDAEKESVAAETDAQETTFIDTEKESAAAEMDAQETTFVDTEKESAAAETDAQETTFVDAEKESVAAETDSQETTFVDVEKESVAAETDAQETTFIDAEKESVAAETDAQETTSVETEKGEGGKDLDQTLKEGTEAEAELEPPLADSTSKRTEQPDNQGSDMEDRQQPSELPGPDCEGEEESEQGTVDSSEGSKAPDNMEDLDCQSALHQQNKKSVPATGQLGSAQPASSGAIPPQETPPGSPQDLLWPPKRPRQQREDTVGATRSVGHLPGATARKQPQRQATDAVARQEKGVAGPSTGRTTRAHPHGRCPHP